MSEDAPRPPDTFIGTNGKIIRKIQHGIVRSTAPSIEISTITHMDPRMLIIQLKDAERERKTEERKIERMINAEELKRQKSRNATNKLLDEIGLDPRYRLK